MIVSPLGTRDYRSAWAEQEAAHARVLAGGEEELLLVEHPPVITFGRRGDTGHLVAAKELLTANGVELVQSDRGGDITFHGPGQIVAYPIVRLADHKLSVSGYVHGLEQAIVRTLATFGIPARVDPAAVGVWTIADDRPAAKIAAIGVRIKRGVSLHGLALNVTTDLRFFELIVPCGLAGRAVTSMAVELGERCPTIEVVRSELTREIERMLVEGWSGRAGDIISPGKPGEG